MTSSPVIGDLPVTWVCNESPSVFDEHDLRRYGPHAEGRFVLAVDGRAVAFTGPHGQSIEWIDT